MDETTALEDYYRVCTLLREDLDQAISDLDFKRQPDHKIYYAVDFSELYEYILPSEAHLDLVLFPAAYGDGEEEKIGAQAIQQLILQYILLEMDPGQIILLPPYLLEFSTFLDKYRSRFYKELVKSADLLYRRFQSIASQHFNDKILDLCWKALQGDASPAEEDQLNSFIGDFGHFQAIVENIDGHNSVIQRLKTLDSHPSFMKLDPALFEGQGSLDTAVFQRWIRKFKKLRRADPGTSKIDAAAMQYLFNTNRLWKPNQRLVLITSSEHMHAIYRHEIQHRRWNWEATGSTYLLRHPRAFSLVQPASWPDSPYNRDDLVKLREMINRFLLHCRSSVPGDCEMLGEYQAEIHEIQAKWRKIQQLVLTLGASQSPRQDAKGKSARNAQVIMDVIRSQFYNGKLVEYLENLFLELDITHEFLRLSIKGMPEPVVGIEPQADLDGLTALSSNTLFMPYKLYLESASAVDRLVTFSSKRDLTARDLITFLKENSQLEDYENLLSNAYVLGAQGWWHFAETYCRRAFTRQCPSDVLCNEGKYFLAVCITQQQESFERLLEAYQLLEEIPNKAEIPHSSRYRIEKGMLILKLNQMRMKARHDIPSVTVGMHQLDSLQAEIRSDAPLWLEVLRTKLDYFYSQGELENLSDLCQEWKALERALLQLEPDGRVWPPAVLDAVAWGKWLLYASEFDLEQERQVLLDMLHHALERTLPDLAIHAEIAFHIAEVKAGPPKTLIRYTL